MSRHHRAEQYELLPRASQDSNTSSDSSTRQPFVSAHYSPKGRRRSLRYFVCLPLRKARPVYARIYRQRGSRGLYLRGSFWILVGLVFFTTVLIVFTAAFRPSYSNPPDHYRALAKRCKESKEPGRGNVNSEKVFIVASLFDPDGVLVGNGWGSAVLQLVELLGPQNVHLSIYENDATPQAKTALEHMQAKAQCQFPWLYP